MISRHTDQTDKEMGAIGRGFIATSKEEVQAFYDAAIAAGAQDDGAPGPRPDYGEDYYGCFVRDADGHKIEAATVGAG